MLAASSFLDLCAQPSALLDRLTLCAIPILARFAE